MKSSFIIIMFSPLAKFIPPNTAVTFDLGILFSPTLCKSCHFYFYLLADQQFALISIFFVLLRFHPILLGQIDFLQLIFP